MKNDSLEGCVREKREREGETAKGSTTVRGREREMRRGTSRRSDENGDAIEEKSVLGEMGRGRRL